MQALHVHTCMFERTRGMKLLPFVFTREQTLNGVIHSQIYCCHGIDTIKSLETLYEPPKTGAYIGQRVFQDDSPGLVFKAHGLLYHSA